MTFQNSTMFGIMSRSVSPFFTMKKFPPFKPKNDWSGFSNDLNLIILYQHSQMGYQIPSRQTLRAACRMRSKN